MSHAGHGRTLYACGHVKYQCRCIDGGGNFVVLDYRCSACKAPAPLDTDALLEKALGLLTDWRGDDGHAMTADFLASPEVAEWRRRRGGK